jgi:hypothetical protein
MFLPTKSSIIYRLGACGKTKTLAKHRKGDVTDVVTANGTNRHRTEQNRTAQHSAAQHSAAQHRTRIYITELNALTLFLVVGLTLPALRKSRTAETFPFLAADMKASA